MSFLGKTFKYINAEGGELTFTYDRGFLINKPAGIDTINVSVSQSTGIKQVGVTVEGETIQPRPVVISGRLVGEFQDENKARLLDVVLPGVPAKLFCDGWYLDVTVTETPSVEALKRFASFSFSLLAPYPFWRAKNASGTVLSGIEPMFKFPWNLTQEYRFGQRILTRLVNIPNRGQRPVPFTLRIDALDTVLNPKLTNAQTGQYLLLEKELAAGESVVVEITHNQTNVTSSVEGDIRGALYIYSALNRLNVGDNVLKPEAESGGENMELTVSFAPERVGIAL